MIKSTLFAAAIAVAATGAFAQASAPEAASAPKHKLSQKLKAAKARHPAASASNPNASPDKKGGE